MADLNQHDPSAQREIDELLAVITDPIERMLLTGEAATIFEAEERYLDNAMSEVLRLLQSGLSDEELGNHRLFALYRSHGSPPLEDSLW